MATDAPSNPLSNPVTSDFNARSFDRPRSRVAPDSLSGHWSNGDDVTIDGSIVWDGASLGERSELRGSIVGIDFEVPADAALIDQIVANEPVAS